MTNPIGELHRSLKASLLHARWRGRSGRRFELVPENLDRFAMRDGELLILAKGNHVMWVGANEELVADPVSRARFRLAMSCADRAFSFPLVDLPGERLSTIWDLEDAAPELSTSAQAA